MITPLISGSARAWNPGTNFNGFTGTRFGCVEQNGTMLTNTLVSADQVGGHAVSNGGSPEP